MKIGYLMNNFFRDQETLYNELSAFFENYFEKTFQVNKFEVDNTIQSVAKFYSRFLYELKNLMDDKLYISLPTPSILTSKELNINLINHFNFNKSFVYFNVRTKEAANLTITNEFQKLDIDFKSHYGLAFDALMKDFILDDVLDILTTNDSVIKETLNKNNSIYNIVKHMNAIKQDLSFVHSESVLLFKERTYTITKEIFDICKPLADIVSLTHDVNIHNDLIVLKEYITNKQSQKITYE